jgi:hypothetical protein
MLTIYLKVVALGQRQRYFAVEAMGVMTLTASHVVLI